MKVRLLNSAFDPESVYQFLTTFMIDDVLAVDVGSLGFASLATQRAVKGVLLTHSHLDHLASLPIFLENIVEPNAEPVLLMGGDSVRASLESDFFNDRVWPDFFRLGQEGASFFRWRTLEPELPIEFEGMKITPHFLNHLVPTLGYVIESGDHAIAIATDTGPTEAIWRHFNGLDSAKAAFLDASFPNEWDWLARASGHMTPALVGQELAKIRPDINVLAVHLKARYRATLEREIASLNIARLSLATPGREYWFH